MALPLIGAALGGLGSLAGGLISSNAAGRAAEKQDQAMKEANALQGQMWNEQKQTFGDTRDQQRGDYQPWRDSGVTALSQLGNADFQRDFTAADMQKDPGYDFRMQEGQKALERSAAARGGLQSGGFMKGLARYGQDYASGEYGKAYDRFNQDRDRRFNRLSSLSGAGLQAAGGMAGASGNYASNMAQYGSNYANNVSNNLMGNGNAQAAANIAQGNAWSGALSGLGKAGMDGAAMTQQGNWMDKYFASQGKK